MRPRHREDSGGSTDPSTRSETNVGVDNGRLLRLFKRTLKDQTPQQRRLLAGDIALEIPSEAVTRGDPEPLWMQHLRTFVRRELDLDPPQPTPGFAVATAEAETLDEDISGGGDRLDDTSHHVPASSDRKGGRPAISPEKARRRLLGAIIRLRSRSPLTDRLTNVALARASGVSPETIGSWLALAEWNLEELEVEWIRRERLRAPRGPSRP